MAYVPNSGSVVAFQGNPSVLQVLATVTNPVTVSSISGTVGASTIGTVPVTQTTVPWIIGSVYGNFSGSVATYQAGTTIASLVSTVPSSVIVGTSIFGQLPAGTAVLGSIATLQGTNPWNIAGSIAAFQAGTQITSISGQITVVSSIAGGIFPVSGSVAAFVTNTNINVSGSVAAFNMSTNASFISLSKDSSVIAILAAPSIVGTYAEDAAHTSADKGIFVLGVRNDAVASFMGSNLEYGPQAIDSAGRTLTKPFSAEESRIEGYASLVSTSVTTLVAAAGAGLRNYVTDFMVANTGATTTLITFKDGAGSVLGYTIAPTGGGSNMTFQTPIRTGANATFDFQPTSASSILFATVKGYKAP